LGRVSTVDQNSILNYFHRYVYLSGGSKKQQSFTQFIVACYSLSDLARNNVGKVQVFIDVVVEEKC